MWKIKTVPFPKEFPPELSQKAAGLFSRSDLGFLRLAKRDNVWTQSSQRAKAVRSQHKRLKVVGMGGSSLGARAFLSALYGPERGQVSFVDNVDPVSLDRELKSWASDKDTHWVLISKSGSTIETLFVANHLLQRSGRPDLLENGITVITEPTDNPLRAWAEKNGVALLEIPEDVGGRFSVFTPAGLMPMAFAGVTLADARLGAEQALKGDLPIELALQYWQSFQEEKWLHALWAYADDLLDLGFWFQQLWAESLAKAQDVHGNAAPRVSTPLVLRGASDQHSVLQQLMEGQGGRLVTFLRVRSIEDFGPELEADHFGTQETLRGVRMGKLLAAEAEATEKALLQAGVPCLRLLGETLTATSLAYLMQTLMICTGMLGQLLEINAFDQPGVESGKKITKTLLAQPSS